MVDSTGVRLRFISSGEWSDGLQRIGSNPISTTNSGAVAEWSKASDCKSLQPSVRIGSAPPSKSVVFLQHLYT